MNDLINQRIDKNRESSEGFYSSDDDTESEQFQMKNSTQRNYLKQPEFQSKVVMETLKQKDDEITGLLLKVADRDNKMLDLATGYLKDLQNMRDQMFKKSDELDYYEVQYFDDSNIDDPKYRELVNCRLSNLKSLYEKKTRELYTYLSKQKNEINNMKSQIVTLESKTKHLDNPEYLLSKVFQLEQNPYLIWKMIQDLKGNEYFFDVFEKQKAQHGINYREINKMLMVTKAYDREFEYYKKGIEEQMCIYIQRACDVINAKDSPYIDEINQLKQQLADEQTKQNTLLNQVQEEIEQYKHILFTRQEQYYEQNMNEINTINNIKVKYAFKLWIILSKIRKNTGCTLKDIMDNIIVTPINRIISSSYKDIEQLYSITAIKCNELQLQLTDNQNSAQFFQIQCTELIQSLNISKQQQEEWKCKCNNYQKCLQLAIKHIDPKMNADQLDLDNQNRETTKSFKERIKYLKQQKNGIQYIQENTMRQQPSGHNQSTQTYICNVNKSIADADAVYQELSPQLLYVESQRAVQGTVKTMDIEVQTTLDSYQMEELCRSVRILKAQNKAQDTDYSIAKLSKTGKVERQQSIDRSQQFERPGTQRSGQPKKRIVQIQEMEESHYNMQQLSGQNSEQNMGPAIKYESEIDNTQQDDQTIIDNKAINHNNIQKLGETRGVFNRLFDDSRKKQERINKIKDKLQKLEYEHWSQIVSLVQFDFDAGQAFTDQLSTSKYYYQEQLRRNIEVEQTCHQAIGKISRAQFYYKKFKDFHIHQSDGASQFQEISFRGDTRELRSNIKSVVESAKVKGRLHMTGLKREDQMFFQQLEKNKNRTDFNKTRQTYSPKFNNTFRGFAKKASPLNLSYQEMSEVRNKQIMRHCQKDYQIK